VRFKVLTAVSMKTAVFWCVVPRSLTQIYGNFRGAFLLHYQDDH
jgi:hypothetical protein